jgi:hypothetical protein
MGAAQQGNEQPSANLADEHAERLGAGVEDLAVGAGQHGGRQRRKQRLD